MYLLAGPIGRGSHKGGRCILSRWRRRTPSSIGGTSWGVGVKNCDLSHACLVELLSSAVDCAFRAARRMGDICLHIDVSLSLSLGGGFKRSMNCSPSDRLNSCSILGYVSTWILRIAYFAIANACSITVTNQTRRVPTNLPQLSKTRLPVCGKAMLIACCCGISSGAI